MSSIEDCLKDILVHDVFIDCDKDRISPTDSFRQDLGVDSLGFVELKAQVEKRFSILISEDDFTPENFSTLSSLVGLINRYRGADRSVLQ